MTIYCEDCKHFRPATMHIDLAQKSYARCAVSALKPEAMISRDLEHDSLEYCSVERSSTNESRCGADARHFEAIV